MLPKGRLLASCMCVWVCVCRVHQPARTRLCLHLCPRAANAADAGHADHFDHVVAPRCQRNHRYGSFDATAAPTFDLVDIQL